MTKKAKAALSKAPLKLTKTEEPVVIDPVLNEHHAAIKAISATHQLLHQGHFTVQQASFIPQCAGFLASLFEAAKAKVMAHPQCDLIPELKEMKKATEEHLAEVERQKKNEEIAKAKLARAEEKKAKKAGKLSKETASLESEVGVPGPEVH